MVRIEDIRKGFAGLVGWRQPYNPAFEIDGDLAESGSGLYFQDAHPMLTLENMASVMPDTWDCQYPEWEAAAVYAEGDKVRHGGAVWSALQGNTGQEPEDGGQYWKRYNTLSDFLRRLTDGGIIAVAQTFLQMKQLTNETRDLLERRTFFDGAGRIRETEQNRHRIVGYEIVPIRAMGVTTKIEKAGLQMAGGTGKVKLYLFHSSQPEPVKEFTLDYTQGGGYQWFTLEGCYLPYISEGNNAGGAWYLCYSQDDLPFGMEAVNVSKDWSREPCGTCNRGSLESWRAITKYMQVSPFMCDAPSTFGSEPRLWDIAKNIYTNTSNYGLNCEVTVGCDITDFMVSQRGIFATALQRQVAATALRTLALNPGVRVNRNQSNASRDNILYELDGNPQGRAAGLAYELKEAYKALSLDTSGLDRVCLACNNRGVRYKSA